MILQITKTLKSLVDKGEPVTVRKDLIEGVCRTCSVETFVQVYFNDGTVKSFARDTKDPINDVSEEWNAYQVSEVWLLNNEGKSLAKLI